MKDKFAEFNKLCAEAKRGSFNRVIVARPQVLGDNYEELIENLNKLADAGLDLCILSQVDRPNKV